MADLRVRHGTYYKGAMLERRFSFFTGRNSRIALYWIIVILVVIVDQATKAAAREVYENAPEVLIPGIVNLVHVENTGAAFSMGEGATLLFIVVAIAFVSGATYLVWSESTLPLGLVPPIALVAGGGLGNLIDRIMKGSVTDFFATAFMDFPVFNVADICVTVGIVLSVVGYWTWESKREVQEAGAIDEQGNV